MISSPDRIEARGVTEAATIARRPIDFSAAVTGQYNSFYPRHPLESGFSVAATFAVEALRAAPRALEGLPASALPEFGVVSRMR